MHAMIAQIPATGWDETRITLIGVVALAGIVYLVLEIANSSRRLFGKRPPVDEQVDGLKKELGETREDCQLRIERAKKEMMEHTERELATLRRERREDMTEIFNRINAVGIDVAYIKGKMEKDEKS